MTEAERFQLPNHNSHSKLNKSLKKWNLNMAQMQLLIQKLKCSKAQQVPMTFLEQEKEKLIYKSCQHEGEFECQQPIQLL